MTNFRELGLSVELDELLKKYRITEPTPIQELTIPRILKGEDVIGRAQTGTGKTLAFLLPMMEKINKDKEFTQGIIITPTRELAIQIRDEAEKLKEYNDINILAAYGGQNIEGQLGKLKRGVHLIIGTPGRILDHVNRGSIILNKIEYLVLDEADEIINMGFFDDVESIIKKTPRTRQTLLYSATMPKRVKNISRNSMRTPQWLEAKEKDITVDQIEEIIINTRESEKINALTDYIDENNPFMGIIFCRKRDRVDTLALELSKRGYVVDALHGELSQQKREQVMKNFRELKTHFLVATDIAARGLDIEGVTHVFNYDAPDREIGYIHRIGRTGRAGEAGVAVTFMTPEDRRRKEMREKDKDKGRTKKKTFSKSSTKFSRGFKPSGKGGSGGRSSSGKSRYSKGSK